MDHAVRTRNSQLEGEMYRAMQDTFPYMERATFCHRDVQVWSTSKARAPKGGVRERTRCTHVPCSCKMTAQNKKRARPFLLEKRVRRNKETIKGRKA